LMLMEDMLSTSFKRTLSAIWTSFLVVGMWNSCLKFLRPFHLHSM
jgi:hypothetical protein